jgi:NAD dependent epimerase/dehydratase family enzyme
VPVKPFMARLAFGEMAEEMLLAGVRAVPTKLIRSSYQFSYPRLLETLRELLRPSEAD